MSMHFASTSVVLANPRVEGEWLPVYLCSAQPGPPGGHPCCQLLRPAEVVVRGDHAAKQQTRIQRMLSPWVWPQGPLHADVDAVAFWKGKTWSD